MKRFALRLGIGLWLSTLTGWAQPPTERAQEFYAKALARKAIGDFRGILQQAGDDPACSLYLLKLFQEDLPGFDAPTQFTTRRLMTLLARGLALRGQPRPLRRTAGQKSAHSRGGRHDPGVGPECNSGPGN